MKFNSQICTTQEQSERLIALGLKKETGDITYFNDEICLAPYNEMECPYDNLVQPAWSLHRLIEMMPQGIQDCSYRCFALAVNSQGVSYEYHYIDEEGKGYNDSIGCTDLSDSLFNDIIAHIEWLIGEGLINKEYLDIH